MTGHGPIAENAGSAGKPAGPRSGPSRASGPAPSPVPGHGPAPGPGSINVFVSYSRADQKRALAVIGGLEKAGFQVWWDGLLEGGQTFLKTTEAALHAADAVVVLWSKTSVDSHWVRDEATHGRDARRLVPLTIDRSEPPLGFRQFQVIDLAKWRGDPSALEFQAVIRAVYASMGEQRAPATQSRPSRAVSRRAVLAGSGLVVVAAAGLATWRFGQSPGGVDRNSVAVLPFRNLSGNASEDYLTQGIAEEIRLALSRNAELKVFAPESTASAGASLGNPVEVARKLGAASLLDGSLRRAGSLMRVVASLTDRASGLSVWTEQFDRPMTDLFAVQSEIAAAVVSALAAQAGKTADDSRSDMKVSGTGDPIAHDAYLRGNAFYALRSGEASLSAALRQYDAAVAADPKFAEALAARARTLVNITQQYGKAGEFSAAYKSALASAQKAAALKPRLAIAQSTLGYVLVQAGLDIAGARGPFELSRQFGQGDAAVMRIYAAFCAQTGNVAGAHAAITRALELDPLNAGEYNTLAYIRLCERDWAGAADAGHRALDLNPRILQSHSYIGKSLFEQRRAAEARVAFQAEPLEVERLVGLAVTEHRLGNIAAADAARSKLLQTLGDASAYQQAQIFAQWGEADAALERLAFARRVGDVGLILLKTDSWMDPLRPRPEFSTLLKSLGFS